MNFDSNEFFKSKTFLVVLFIFFFIVTLALYGSTLKNFYTADDFHQMYLASQAGFGITFSHLNFHFAPLPMIFYKVIYNFWGLSPLSYRIFLFTINSLNCVLVYLITLKIFAMLDYTQQDNSLIGKALLSTIIFAFMNVHTETVISVACYLEMLFSFFYLYSLYYYLVYKESNKSSRFVLIIVFFILSLLSKENALSFLILVFIIEKIIFQNGFILFVKKYYFMIVVSIAYLIFRILSKNQMGEIIIRGAADYVSESIKNIIFTFTGFIFSFDFIKIKDIYKNNQVNLFNTVIELIKSYPISVVLVSLALIFYLLVILRRNKVIVFGFWFIFITILPYIWLAGYERYFYLPSLGFVLIFSEYFVNLYLEKTGYKKIVHLIISVFVIYNIFHISARKNNWGIASNITQSSLIEIQQVCSNLPDSSRVYFRNLPDNYNGAWIFRDGVQYFPSLFLHRPDLCFKKIYEEDINSEFRNKVYVYDYNGGNFVLEH